MPSKRRRGSRRGRRLSLDPNINLIEDTSISTADTAVNTTLYTSADKTLTTARLRSLQLACRGGAASTLVYFVIRRVPYGYSAPSITVSTSGSALIDQPNVMAVGFLNFITGNLDPQEATFQYLRPQMTFYEADTMVLQVVPNISSSSLVFGGLVEFGSRQI